jgi:hypothetical protein
VFNPKQIDQHLSNPEKRSVDDSYMEDESLSINAELPFKNDLLRTNRSFPSEGQL